MEINHDEFKKMVINRLGKIYNICKDVKNIIYWMSFEPHPLTHAIRLYFPYFLLFKIQEKIMT